MNDTPRWHPPEHPVAGCELCLQPGGILVAQAPQWRVIRVADDDFPAFYRVVWQAHHAEMSDLAPASRHALLDVVMAVETVLRARVPATKINLASLGNVVPHLHWHVIARFDWDSHFPQPIWGQRQRAVDPPARLRLPVSLAELDAEVAAALAAVQAGGPLI